LFNDQLFAVTTSIFSLTPCHKLKYFEHASWELSWIKAAKEIVRAVFKQSYAAPLEDIPPSETKKKTVWLVFNHSIIDQL
jgi:hypothetical protein